MHRAGHRQGLIAPQPDVEVLPYHQQPVGTGDKAETYPVTGERSRIRRQPQLVVAEPVRIQQALVAERRFQPLELVTFPAGCRQHVASERLPVLVPQLDDQMPAFPAQLHGTLAVGSEHPVADEPLQSAHHRAWAGGCSGNPGRVRHFVCRLVRQCRGQPLCRKPGLRGAVLVACRAGLGHRGGILPGSAVGLEEETVVARGRLHRHRPPILRLGAAQLPLPCIVEAGKVDEREQADADEQHLAIFLYRAPPLLATHVGAGEQQGSGCGIRADVVTVHDPTVARVHVLLDQLLAFPGPVPAQAVALRPSGRGTARQ